ncbi:glycosyltransferase [Burkholderia pseudomultivorans]|uniref:Glycosyltransferase EpsJ n=1 Tax=Burkholderia pseudomultivorans TaxID=1207504 RepID=A0ABU2E336_9BURK|nr:glycosyltransferase [Burkholderia pseudomultivorans]MDR8727551.1 putative glycosyltransferase EpsJ [Burkholderia pseudomultivorans]MDR8736579.1 putative glycosyltransferase EpsJ [Burkholderia pseudomultivorans]MDR8740497.1 putative glycosyltransferase EpsJ [Burkholderia pseudomultivorans]MDR8754054.1 putative glycosyltransferase EpsJ [Burkholderia pseudomultivorans]MDR8776911.1 putative glycosyltransferase EpsJ [Burkholderia pseudomultivorans]
MSQDPAVGASVERETQLQAAFARHRQAPHDLAIVGEVCDLLAALRRDDECLPWADRALAIDPDHPRFLAIRAFALNLLGRHAEAAATWTRAASISGNTARDRLRIGYSLMMAGDVERATALLGEARRMLASGDPQGFASATHLLGEAMLKAEDPRGFAHWPMRTAAADAGSYRPARVPAWNGQTDLRGRRVLITHQLGFGDNFLLYACVADWHAAGAQLMITCDPQIHALLQASLPDCEVVAAERPLTPDTALPDAVQARVDAFGPQLWATLLHLPLLRAAHAPAAFRFAPYLQAPHAKRQRAGAWAKQLRDRHPGKKLIGLFWDCHQRHHHALGSAMRCWAVRRSLPLATLERITTDPAVRERVQFVSLHHPLLEAETGMPGGDVERFAPGIDRFDDTAACIETLDAVLAVDSAVANLAAMMGKPTCVPVNTSGDWRWGARGRATPWIEAATVLRQTHEGDWDALVPDMLAWCLSGAPGGARESARRLSTSSLPATIRSGGMADRKPRISVVIPAFDAGAFLDEAIESLLAQTGDAFEVIVVDDGSTDDTARVLARHASHDAVRTIALSRNAGEAVATNLGIQAARGEYIARLDADDVALPERFHYQTDVLDCNPWVTVCGGQATVFDHASKAELGRSAVMLSDADIKTALLDGGGHFITSTTMWRRDWFVERNIWWRPDLASSRDHRFWIDAMLAGAAFANLDRDLVRYRRHGHNISLNADAMRDATRLNREVVLRAFYPALTGDERRVLLPVLEAQHFGVDHLVDRDALSAAVAVLDRMAGCIEPQLGENRRMLADFVRGWKAIALSRLHALSGAPPQG